MFELRFTEIENCPRRMKRIVLVDENIVLEVAVLPSMQVYCPVMVEAGV